MGLTAGAGQRGVEDVAGVPTVTLRFPCAEDRRTAWTPVLVVIPGNPGVVDYYEPFLRKAHAALGGAVDLMCSAGISLTRTCVRLTSPLMLSRASRT